MGTGGWGGKSEDGEGRTGWESGEGWATGQTGTGRGLRQCLTLRPDPNPYPQPVWPYNRLLGVVSAISLAQLRIALLARLLDCYSGQGEVISVSPSCAASSPCAAMC